jgi:hypothetical protein
VRIFIDAQHDHLHDRTYLLGALICGCEGGQPSPRRRRSIVRMAAEPPTTDAVEQQLYTDWVDALLRAIVAVAAPDEQGELNAPLHLIFYDRQEQRVVLDGLSRHLHAVMGATSLFDFVTQLPAFDSPIASFLSDELRDQKLLSVVCPSRYEVAQVMKFDWSAGTLPFNQRFHHRIFDTRGRLDAPDGNGAYFASRARFGSAIPLEYAYAAWGELPSSDEQLASPYRAISRADLLAFQARRMEAMEHITAQFRGNHLTSQRPFRLPEIATHENAARSLAHALHEFVVLERHAELAEWKRAHLLAPERRVMDGTTLLVRYVEADQSADVAARNRENSRRYALRQQMKARSDAELSQAEKNATKWDDANLEVRLRIAMDGIDATLDDVLSLATYKTGDQVLLYPRLTTDSRQPLAERTPFTPTPRQLLYGGRGLFDRLEQTLGPDGKPMAAWVRMTLRPIFVRHDGYVFPSTAHEPFVDGKLYTLEEDPNSWQASRCEAFTQALAAVAHATQPLNIIYDHLARRATSTIEWSSEAVAGQARFFAGLRALDAAGLLATTFEASKEQFIAGCGDDPLVVVQGPPGTGKSFTTAYALLARLQGALVADRDYRIVVSCMTHAAIDVLLGKLIEAMTRLRAVRQARPDLFDTYFTPSLLDVPLLRLDPRTATPDGIVEVPPVGTKLTDVARRRRITQERWCVVGGTPNALYTTMRQKPLTATFGQGFAHCLVLDEASQVRLPEAMLSAMAARPDAQVIVVGDPRQMPPIMKHQWEYEPRRTFQAYRAFASLYEALLPLQPRLIQFTESFRLHADMAEFLRRRIYQQDGIAFFSRQQARLAQPALHDDFVRAALDPASPLVVIVHDEDSSQMRNTFEEALLLPILGALADPAAYGLDAASGFGVVVPHRAQRAALQAATPGLAIRDLVTGETLGYAVDTVERYQGSERTVIIVSATESDPRYLLASSGFLLDPRRLTVALSRAKQKMILIAARSVFALFSPDEETFANAQVWKSLLRETCRQSLWSGERAGHHVQVWGNGSADPPSL